MSLFPRIAMVAEDDAALLLQTFAATIVQAGVRRYLARKHYLAKVHFRLS